jgi:hypothetical protein
MGLAEYLEACEERYSSELHLLGGPFYGPGYHSRVPDGTYAHDILNSMNYALALLASGTEEHVARASDILRKVLTLQETDPTSEMYGLWPWLAEEPLAAMAQPDPNWADFGGARLAQVLSDHEKKLPKDIGEAVRVSLGHAAYAIFRRNTGPAHTNIAITGAGVTAAAGELLRRARLLDYGRRRLHNIVRHTKHHGGFNEYNSPTYTMVALHECERILSLVRDPQARSDAEWLRQAAWQTIAEHFHPGTGQWAGPHSRAYSLRLLAATADYMAEQSGVDIPSAPRSAGKSPPPQYPPIACPKPLAERFRALPRKVVEARHCFIRRETDENSTWGTTWMVEDACLGSVSQDNLWAQRHVLLGYWWTPDDPAVALRLRFLKDGKDLASAFVRTAQAGPRALSVFSMTTDLGDYHHTLDRPADGLFMAQDFRVRYELSGKGVEAMPLGRDRYVLVAGDRRAVIHAMTGRFGPYEVKWACGKEGDTAFVDGICYSEARLPFDLGRLGKVILGAGLEVLTSHDLPAATSPSIEEHTEETVCVTWSLPDGGLMVETPTRAHPYPK